MRIDWAQPAHDDDSYDILLLGGSALHRDWGQIEEALAERLAENGRKRVRIFNLAMPAHTSRDSRLKYAALADARFELVVFYHGINEARANNAPPDVFQSDYSHYSWYKIVNGLAAYHGTASFALPYTLRYLAGNLDRVLHSDRYVSTYGPPQAWVPYGREPRSAASFERNLSAILDLAAWRGDPVLLMTFATYVAPGYTFEAFREKRLEYGLHRSAIETWGDRQHVLNTIRVHNEIVRREVAEREGVLFVDQAELMPGSPRHFNDVCHFTVAGSLRFVDHMLSVLPAGDETH